MLVLTRKPGERVLIGDDIVITILESRGDGIRIGIDAPRGITIQRDEIVRAVSEANIAATQTSPGGEAQLKAALGLVPAAAVSPAAAAAPPAAASPAAPASPTEATPAG